MQHHGQILKKYLDRQGITQDSAAKSLGMARTNFRAYLDKTEFKEPFLKKLSESLGIPRSTFPELATTVVTGTGNAVGTNNTTNVSTLSDCRKELEHWMALAKANEDRALAYAALAEERKEMIDLLRKSNG